jgi:hypothetical protein
MKITGRNVKVIPIDIGEVVGRLSDDDRSFQETVFKESSEDVNLRAFIIESNLSAESKVAIADTLYGTGSMGKNHQDREILPIELTDELMRELVMQAIRNRDMLKILSSVTNTNLEVVEVQNSQGENNIIVRGNGQNYFIVGENDHFIRILPP